MIEAVIASALLMTAMTSLARYAQSSSELSRAADAHLAARLASTNAIERLRSLPVDQWPDRAADIAADVSNASGIPTKIALEEFRMGDREALHATIRSQVGKNTSNAHSHTVENHFWRTTLPQEKAEDKTEEKKETP